MEPHIVHRVVVSLVYIAIAPWSIVFYTMSRTEHCDCFCAAATHSSEPDILVPFWAAKQRPLGGNYTIYTVLLRHATFLCCINYMLKNIT